MKTIHCLGLFLLLLCPLAALTSSSNDCSIYSSPEILSPMTPGHAAQYPTTIAINTPQAYTPISTVLADCATMWAADAIIGNLIIPITKHMERVENILLNEKWYKTGLCWCIFRRLIPTVFANIVRSKLIAIMNKQEARDSSKLLLSNFSIFTAVSLFTIKNLLDKNGLRAGCLAYLKKWQTIKQLEHARSRPTT